MSMSIESEAVLFRKNAMAELDRVIVNEDEAKHALLLTLASPAKGPTGLALVGGTGSGKTTLSDHSHELISDLTGVADLPPESDLRPQEVVGGQVTLTTEVEVDGGKPRTESRTQTVFGLIDTDTQAVKLNEIDTINSQSLNVIREILASGTLITTEGKFAMNGLLYFISTKNPLDNGGKFKVSDAMVSRHAVGAYMGHDDEQNISTVQAILRGFKPAEVLDPVVDLETLQAIKEYARDGIVLPETLLNSTSQRIVAASRALIKEFKIDDTPQRLTTQVLATAQADAALKGEKHITPDNVDTALRSALLARIGLRGMLHVPNGKNIPQIVDEIVARR